MDSIYDAPRQPPIPTKIEKVNPASLSVPEVSVFCSNRELPFSATKEFNLHKPNRQVGQPLTDNEIFLRNNPLSSGKRVHFQPTLTNVGSHSNLINDKTMTPSHEIKENIQPTTQSKFDLNGKSFKHIYLANIPNRDLDLSILEPNISNPSKTDSIEVENNCNLPKKSPFEPSIHFDNFNGFKEYFNKNQNSSTYSHCDCRSEISTKQHKEFHSEKPLYTPSKVIEKSDKAMITHNQTTDLNRLEDREPTFRDLFEIIKQQNQQILSLQQQLFNLQNCIQYRNTTPTLPSSCEEPILKQQQQQQRLKAESPKRGLPKKFSFDLKATSFEVSFRPQQQHKFRKLIEPKISEISETGDSLRNINDQEELRLDLQQSIDVRENCPSPTPSIQIDMDDIEGYDSSNDESEEIGTSLYQDIIGQVNHMLERVNIKQSTKNAQPLGSDAIQVTANEVKEATVKYLQSIGVNSTDDTKKPGYSPSDVSFAVKQLLLKYLPDDQLASLRATPVSAPQPPQANILNDRRGGAEFSFATVQYMQKYNLLGNKTRRTKPQMSGSDTPKILDISTLKLQPKLL